MHKLFTRLLVAAAFLSVAAVASAVEWPNPGCTDSVNIRQIQDPLYNPPACRPAVGDTVRGVGGIIIGFDPIATGFDAFMQVTGGGPFSGIDVFFHGVNPTAAPHNLAIGDSIVVEWMRTGEFGGATQVLAPNNNFGAPNGIVRKVSSGNPLPPFFEGTTTQLQELPTNTFAEQYEGCLVKINGPLTVARTSLQVPGIGQNNAFLVVSASAPADSVFIDGNKLTQYPPPAVGTPIISVQGILNQTSRGYRIMLRNGNDIVVNTPPNVTDAYPVQDNVIKVKFDRDVTNASATNLTNYSLASFGSIDAVVMQGTDAALVTVTNGLGHGEIEVITVNGVVGVAAGQAMTTPQSRTFVNGLLTAEEVQRANADSLVNAPECVDRSRFAGPGGQISQGPGGTRASMVGVMGARYGTVYYMMDAGNPLRGGVAAFAPPSTLNLGTRYRLTGAIQEFFGETEFSFISEVEDLGAQAVPSPVNVIVRWAAEDTCDYSNALIDGEHFEGRLVHVPNVKVVQRFDPLPTNGFHIADQSFPDTIFVQNFNGAMNPFSAPALGSRVSITGVGHYEGGSFRIIPRNSADVVNHGLAGVGGNGGRLAFSVHPNPSRKATFSVTLPQESDVEIGIYDVAGRQVTTLLKGRMPAGQFSREWAGTDSDGRAVNAGVYFARMKAGGEEQKLTTVFLGR
jgi:hypothetical protein